MDMKKLFVLFAVFLAVSGMAMAIRGATIDGTFTPMDRWTGATGSAGVDTEGGNITYGNLNGSSLTDRWAGYFGNITGANIYLTDGTYGSSTTYLYSWGVAGANQTGEVCVSTDQTFSFADAEGSTGADFDGVYTWTGADDAEVTFDGTGCNLIFEEQGVDIATTAYADGDSGNSSFYTCIIDNGATATHDDFAFCTNITVGGTNYFNQGAEYELVAPTDDSTPTSTTTYYFFIEIN